MDEAKAEGQEIIDADRTRGKLPLKKIAEGCYHNGAGYQEFHPFAVETDQVKYTQCQGECE
jgi:hypothetical protein